MKVTAVSPANIAFIKYWGRKDHKLFLPLSTTNSMNLSNCLATTTAEFSKNHEKDEIVIIADNGEEKILKKDNGGKTALLFDFLDRARGFAATQLNVRIISKLNFPFQAGIASSAAGMSALAAAVFKSLDLKEKYEDKKELSREVRLMGSVSAARSVEDGFTECTFGETHEESFTQQIAPVDHWDLVDMVVVLKKDAKKITSDIGHKIAETSPFFEARIDYLKEKPEKARQAILDKDFDTLGNLSEVDTINMHAIMMTSTPPAFYFTPGSIDIIHKVYEWREKGIHVFFTFDAGPNPHLITTQSDLEKLKSEIEKLDYVDFTISNKPAEGTRFLDEHNF